MTKVNAIKLSKINKKKNDNKNGNQNYFGKILYDFKKSIYYN